MLTSIVGTRVDSAPQLIPNVDILGYDDAE
jgi:hypothetical protein